ncbi:GGDEF domain-containing protein [Pseudomonas sp. ML96]|uniref:GGDEF domain-containing protein n=1 Tax=Pseudomonas sp. ML96 TaxID=1523503 RepID=UPI0005BB9711|nr:GGDEF domain-containing protein [Pseudomonas sp. ML96]
MGRYEELPPDSQSCAHAKALNDGFPWLLFARPLEKQYREHVRESQPPYQRLTILLALAIWAMFTFVDSNQFHILQNPADHSGRVQMILLARFALLLGLALVAVLLFVKHSVKYTRTLLPLVMLVIGGVSALIMAWYRLEHQPKADGVLLLIVIAVFFPLGMSFYRSILLALSICLLTAISGWLLLQGEELDAQLALSRMQVLATVVGAVGGYIREHAQREQFLLQQLLRWQANHDPLTQLHNRRSFDNHLDMLLHQAQRDGTTLTLVILDIDYFKLYNDRYGHQAGDAALQAVGQVLSSFQRRPLDMAVRLGGEEFALLLYSATPSYVAEQTEALLAAVVALNIEHAASPVATHLTLSVGATISTPTDTSESIYQRADALLYQAKQAGRNRVVLGIGDTEVSCA